MGVFNTLRGNKTSVLEEQINKHETKNQEFNNKIPSLLALRS